MMAEGDSVWALNARPVARPHAANLMEQGGS